MTTQQVADRLVELCRTGQVLQAQEELFADNVTSVSPDMKGGSETTVGKAENIEKGITQKRLDVSGLSSGTYILQVITDNEIRGKQFQIK